MMIERFHASRRTYLGLLALIPVLILLALLILVPPDGSERAGWVAYIGHFHPLAVHLPIAFILLVPVLELAGTRALHFRSAVPFVLGLALLTALVAPLLGWGLAWSGGFSGPLVTQHMWGGAAVAAGCWVCWILRGRLVFGHRQPGQYLYALALLATVVLVPFTGYRGGQLAHGETHLTEHMPTAARRWLHLSASNEAEAKLPTNVDSDTFYGARIHPIFAARCVSCHGANKHKGNLRLDSYTGLMRGGKDGPVVKHGDVKGSELFRRITLPHEHEDFMPTEGKRPLTANEVRLIELWIGAGASNTLPVHAIAGAPAGPLPTAVPEVTIEEFDPLAVQEARAALAPVVSRLRERYPSVLDYESRGSAYLHLSASLLGRQFGDRQLLDFAPLADHVVLADFSGTSITDRSAALIATMTRLRVLHMRNTQITDQTVQAFSELHQLQSLNIFGVPITRAALPTLERLPELRRVYVAKTDISTRITEPRSLTEKLRF